MVSNEDAARLRAANQELAALVTEELEGVFLALNLQRPEHVRNSMIEILPLLIDKYGPLAGQVSAEWYRSMMPGSTPEVIGLRTSPEQVESKVRWAAAGLFQDDPFSTLNKLTSALGKWTRQPGRDTIQINANRDKVGWMRQPSGTTTCAFCLMLASRSAAWLYNSQESALRPAEGDSDKYHGECDCEPVLVRSADDVPDSEFDHQGAYVAYTQARQSVGDSFPSTDQITAALRRMYPDILTDGVHEHH